MTIELSQVKDFDEVKLQDHDGNLITSVAHIDGIDRDQLFVIAFGTRIYFARRTKAGWQRVAQITVIGHQPTLFA